MTKKSKILISLGVLGVGYFLYKLYKKPTIQPNQPSQPIPGPSQPGGQTEVPTGQIAQPQDTGYEDIITLSGGSDAIPTTQIGGTATDAAYRRKMCALKGGTWQPNSAGGGICYKIPAPTPTVFQATLMSNPTFGHTSTSSSSTSSSQSSGGYGGSGGGGMTMMNTSNQFSSYPSQYTGTGYSIHIGVGSSSYGGY